MLTLSKVNICLINQEILSNVYVNNSCRLSCQITQFFSFFSVTVIDKLSCTLDSHDCNLILFYASYYAQDGDD